MKTKTLLQGIFAFLLIGATTMLSAQTNTNQFSPSTVQDSVTFHQWLIEQGRAENASSNYRNEAMNLSGTLYSNHFTLGGNANTFYPVSFLGENFHRSKATTLKIGRWNIHENGMWHGSLIADFRFHVSNWGSGSDFIDANIHFGSRPLIAGWEDATIDNISYRIVIWLRGATTYYFHSNTPQTPLQPPVFPGGSLTIGNRTFFPKSQVAPYVNSFGPTFSQNVSVRGTLRASEVRVSIDAGADFVFEPDYNLMPLEELEQFIIENRHLPEIAPARYMIRDGVDVGEFQIQLLQKIEELTLHLIEQNRQIRELQKEMESLRNRRTE